MFVRNIVGAVFPLCTCRFAPSRPALTCSVARQMFIGMGNQWALFLLSMVSFLMVPIPFYLYKRGKQVRQRSPYCATHFGKD